MSSSAITNSKLCKYCNQVQIYWNTTKKAYYEVETGNKHFCQVRTKPTNTLQQQQPTNSPTYYNAGTGKPLNLQTKQQHSNSIQVLKGSEQEVQKEYETLADIVAALGGKIYGSQSHYLNEELIIIVYYEVPTSEQRKEVKQRLNQIF